MSLPLHTSLHIFLTNLRSALPRHKQRQSFRARPPHPPSMRGRWCRRSRFSPHSSLCNTLVVIPTTSVTTQHSEVPSFAPGKDLSQPLPRLWSSPVRPYVSASCFNPSKHRSGGPSVPVMRGCPRRGHSTCDVRPAVAPHLCRMRPFAFLVGVPLTAPASSPSRLEAKGRELRPPWSTCGRGYCGETRGLASGFPHQAPLYHSFCHQQRFCRVGPF